MNKKILIVAVIALLVGGGAYKTVFAKGKPEPKPKVDGAVYVLPKEFLVNLADGRFAKVSVGMVMAPDDHSTGAEGGEHGAAAPPEGYGSMPQEAIVRDVITNALTDSADSDLIEAEGRAKLKAKILRAI